MIKNFEQFLNEGANMYTSGDNTFMEALSKLTIDCGLANIEFVKENGGAIELKKPIKVHFYADGSTHEDSIIKLVKKEISALEIGSDVDAHEEFGGMVAKNDDGEYLIAITTDGERIVLETGYTCPTDAFFNINSELEYQFLYRK